MRSVLTWPDQRANARHTSPGRKTAALRHRANVKPPTGPSRPARATSGPTPRASGVRLTTASSAPVRIHLRIRLVRVNRGAPDLSAEPTDWLRTTRFRRCDRSLIAASCNPRLRPTCPRWYAFALCTSLAGSRPRTCLSGRSVRHAEADRGRGQARFNASQRMSSRRPFPVLPGEFHAVSGACCCAGWPRSCCSAHSPGLDTRRCPLL